jgi:hypothetical protein
MFEKPVSQLQEDEYTGAQKLVKGKLKTKDFNLLQGRGGELKLRREEKQRSKEANFSHNRRSC